MIPLRRSEVPPRVLVVDDSRTLRMILARSLRALGCEVFEASDGQEALAVLQRLSDVDLMLVDLNMPGMDGCELVQAVRADPALAHVPAIMVTAASDVGDLARAKACGAEAHLPKPFTPDLLRECLESIGLLPRGGTIA